MHICYICSEYPPAPHGGIGSFTQTLARSFVQRGHHVTVVGLYPECSDDAENWDEGVRIIRMAPDRLPGIRFFRNRSRYAKALRELHATTPIDIIEGGELDVGMLHRDAPGQIVLRMHGGPHFFATGPRPGLVFGLKERWAFRIAEHLVAVSHCVANTTRKLLALGDRPVTVIPNPVDVESFSPAAGDSLEEPGLIVFVGTITERKGIRQLLEAMPSIVAEVPEAHLEIYGGDDIGFTGEPFSQVLARSMSPTLSPHIHWKGRVPRRELPRVLKRASVCVYPSHMEAMPIAWIEGLATGRPVVASETGPGPELIDHGITGLLCNPHDPGSIASQITRLLKDPILRRNLGEAARRMVVERYALDRIVDKNIEYYQSIVRR